MKTFRWQGSLVEKYILVMYAKTNAQNEQQKIQPYNI